MTGNFTDVTFNKLKELDIIPIVDLCHFGVTGLAWIIFKILISLIILQNMQMHLQKDFRTCNYILRSMKFLLLQCFLRNMDGGMNA